MEYGSDEHLDGLSRGALKSEVRWWWSRAEEMEAENAKLFALLKHESGQNDKLRKLVADLWEFGFSENAGASSVKEWHRRHDELRDRMYELLGVDA